MMAGEWDVVSQEPMPRAPAAPRPVERTSAAAQSLGGSTTATQMPKAPPSRGMSIQPPAARPQSAAPAPAAAPGEWDVVSQQPVAPQRDVGMGEGIARIIGQSAIPVTRTLGLAAASLVNIIGGRDAAEKVFAKTDEVVRDMEAEYNFRQNEQVGLPTQILGGVASTPIELVGGFGAQHGIERSAQVLQRGGTGKEAALAGGVSGAVHAGLNLLPVKAGGAVGRTVERVVERGVGARAAPVVAAGLTGGAIGAGGNVAGTAAENAALPEGEQFAGLKQEATPGIAAGLGAAFGAGAGRAQNRGGRKAAEAAGEPVSAVEADLTPEPKATKPKLDPETRRLAQKAQDLGIPLRPDMLTDSRMAKFFGDVMEKVPLGGSKAGERQKAFNRAVMDQLGAEKSAEALTPEVFDEAISRAGQEIGDISARTSVPEESFGDLAGVARRDTPDIQQVISTYADDLRQVAADHGGVVPGDRLRKLRTEAASQARGSTNGDLRRALGDFVDRLDDAIARHAPEEDIQALTDARRRYAVAKTLEPLVAKSATGDISPAALMGRVTSDRAGKARMARGQGGELGDLARIGQKFLKEPPSSGTAERLATGGAVAGVGMGALLNPGTASAAAGTVAAANAYNRLGPKMVARRLAKEAAAAGPAEAEVPAVAAPASPASPAAPAAAERVDPRLAEIARLREGASPETLKALDEHEKVVQKEIKAQQVKEQRDAEALNLEKAAAKTTDPGIKAALIERANKLRSEKIPVGEAEELTSVKVPVEKPGRIPVGEAKESIDIETPRHGRLPVGDASESIDIETTKHGRIPAGRAVELSQVPGPKVSAPRKPLPVGAAREVTVQQAEPAQPIEPTQIPVGEAVELQPEEVTPARRPAETPVSAAGSDTEAELTMLQPGAPARGPRLPAEESSSSPRAKPASWVIREKGTGKVVMETFDPKKVDALNTAKYEAVPILQHLQELNRSIKGGQTPGDLKRGALPAKPFKQRAELENTLRSKLGHKLVDGLLQRNVITLGEAPADVPRDAQGRFTGNTVELFHNRLDSATAPGVLMHEVGMHYGMEKMLGEQRYAELLADIRKMRQRPEVAKAWAEVKRNYPELDEASPEFAAEVGAHLVEAAPDAPIVRRMLDGPRAYLYKNFGVNVGKVDPDLLRALATGALRKSAGVEAVSPNVAAAATASAQQEEPATQ